MADRDGSPVDKERPDPDRKKGDSRLIFTGSESTRVLDGMEADENRRLTEEEKRRKQQEARANDKEAKGSDATGSGGGRGGEQPGGDRDRGAGMREGGRK